MQNRKELVNCLFIADILGKPGRKIVSDRLQSLRKEFDIDLCVANCENASGGKGITVKVANALFSYGIDVLTSGNHVWAQKEIIPYLESHSNILRPANYPPGAKGSGFGLFPIGKGYHIGVLNLQGRVFMKDLDCPFRVALEATAELRRTTKVILVDFHAEATSEKNALGRYLDGRVSAVLGTHTHVGTSDARILPQGTAFITDVGMVGPTSSIIGNDIDAVIQRFLTQIPQRLPLGQGPTIFNSVLIEIEQSTGKALNITRIDRKVN